jgi:TPR repeat protein
MTSIADEKFAEAIQKYEKQEIDGGEYLRTGLRCAEEGCVAAMRFIGEYILQEENPIPPGYTRTFWLEQASQKGDARASIMLAEYFGMLSANSDEYDKALQYIALAQEQATEESVLFHIAQLRMEGGIRWGDFEETIKLFPKAAQCVFESCRQNLADIFTQMGEQS